MKILLYEPGTTGHRPVILRYTKKVLDRAGVEWVYEGCSFNKRPNELIKRAKEECCDIIYLMTIDGQVLFSWNVGRIAKREGIKVIGVYYLYNNLIEGWRSVVWKVLFAFGVFGKIFVSDDELRYKTRIYPKEVWYLPDPWDRSEFMEYEKLDARRRLGLPPDKHIFLMFGMIDKRKGGDKLVRAAMRLSIRGQWRNTAIVFAGVMAPDIVKEIARCNKIAREELDIVCVNRVIEENDVPLYFFAADFVVCAYSKSFRVSSNTVTRALAAGRPVIVPDNGANGRAVNKEGCGLIYKMEKSVVGLSDAIVEGTRLLDTSDRQYEMMGKNGRRFAEDRELEIYGTRLLDGLHDLTGC